MSHFALLFPTLCLAVVIATVKTSKVERSAISYVWEDATVPYVFTPEFPQRDREMFLKATDSIQRQTCIRFREKTSSDRFWVNVLLQGCCWTVPGRQIGDEGRGQGISFSSGLILPYYQHELGHTLGFPHEQDRSDRDDYIYWDEDKTPSQCRNSSFASKYNALDQAALDIDFDYVSLMADWTECYWPYYPVPQDTPLGPGTRDDRTFSVLDIEKLNAMYDCRGCYGYRFRKVEQLSANQKPFPAGYELNGRTFYICRGYHEGHLLVGKSIPDENRCYLAFDGGEIKYTQKYSIMTNPYGSNLRWIRRPDNGAIPRNAVKGGRTAQRETIYIGRCLQNVGNDKTLIPGFFLASNAKELRITFGGGTIKCSEFVILVCEG